jgi:hypothetical protein
MSVSQFPLPLWLFAKIVIPSIQVGSASACQPLSRFSVGTRQFKHSTFIFKSSTFSPEIPIQLFEITFTFCYIEITA